MSRTNGPRGRRRRPLADGRDDGGYALVTVIGAMFVLTMVSAAALTSALQGQKLSRPTQDSEAALAAAQAGVAHLVTRINLCRDYWLAPWTCPTTPELAGPGAGGWIPDDDPTTTTVREGLGDYRLHYLAAPEALLDNPATTSVDERVQGMPDDPSTPGTEGKPERVPGLIRAEVTGRVNGVERVVTVDIRQPGFLQYLYYTDFEAKNPAQLMVQYPAGRFYDKYSITLTGTVVDFTDVTFTGITLDQAEKCRRYYYGGTQTRDVADAQPTEYLWGTRVGATEPESVKVPRSCEIEFAGTDQMSGPVHTNDRILLQSGVRFLEPVTTSWPTTSTPLYQPSAATLGAGSQQPAYADPVTLPDQAEGLPEAAQRGCVFTGPTAVEFLGSGKLKVTTETTTQCAGVQVTKRVPTEVLPPNGVVHVQRQSPSTTCTGAALEVLGAYPVADDITKYDCNAGDVFVRGTVKGMFTVSAADDIVVVEDVTYAGDLSGGDILGLVAEGDVEVYHPVTCDLTPDPVAPKVCPDGNWAGLPSNGTEPTRDVKIDAAVISMDHAFTVQNHDKGGQLGQIRVRGGIYQRFRGPVGTVVDTSTSTTSGSIDTGFLSKQYQYDRRLRDVPPPAFPVPSGVQWSVTAFTEQSCSVRTTGCRS